MRKKPIIIGVTGGSGGGKTSVSKAILANFQVKKHIVKNLKMLSSLKVSWSLKTNVFVI